MARKDPNLRPTAAEILQSAKAYLGTLTYADTSMPVPEPQCPEVDFTELVKEHKKKHKAASGASDCKNCGCHASYVER